MGKWSSMKDQLVKFVEPEPWQKKIDEIKHKEYAKLSRLELSKEFVRVAAEKDALKELLSVINTREAALDQIMSEQLETEGESSVKNDFGTFFIKDDVYTSVQDKLAFNAWIRSEGMEDLLSVNYQTTSGIVKTRLEEGKTVPPGIAVFMKTSIGYRRPSKV